MRNVIGRLAIALLSILILLVIAAYLFREEFLRIGASKVLSPYGIQIEDVQTLTLGTSHVSIRSARFRMTGAEEDNALENLAITFDLKGLLKGRIKRVDLEYLKIAAIDTPALEQEEVTSSPASGAKVNLQEIVRALQSVPVDSIAIDRLQILTLPAVFSLAFDTSAREINATLISEATTVVAQANWHDADYVSSYFIPDDQLASHNFSDLALTGSVQVLDQQNLVSRTDFTLSDAGEHLLLDAAGEVQIDSLMPLLYRYELLEDAGYDLAGALYFSASVQEEPGTGGQALSTAITLRQDSFITGTIPTFPNDPETTFQWHPTQPFSVAGTYRPSSSAFELSASAQHMVASLHTNTGDRQATFDISRLTGQCVNATRCSGHQETSISLPAFSINELEVQNLSAATSADISYDNGELTVHLNPGSRIGAGTISEGNLALIDASILVQENIDLVLKDGGDLTITSAGTELHLPALKTGENTSQGVISLSQVELTKSSSAPDFQGTAFVQVHGIASDLLPFVVRKPEFSSKLTLTGESIAAEGLLQAGERDILSFQGSHDLGTGAGSGRFVIPVQEFGPGETSLAQIFLSFPYDADIVDGTVEANAALQWQTGANTATQVSGPLHLALSGLSGFFADMALLSLTTTVDGQLTDTVNFISAPDLQLEIGSFDPGVPVENIKLVFSVNTQALTAQITNLSARIFDGTLQSAGLNYDWQAEENLFDVEISRIDLARVLSLGSYEGVTATGLISGHVPVRIAGSNVSVNGGSLHVEPPGGTIRYLSAATGSGNPALDLVNQALSNYQYSAMDTEVSYLPNGDLNLDVQLQGRNPDMNQGQRINLNLNVSDNIPALLESLQASRNITDALQRELENR